MVYVVFDGPSGGGKTTVAKELVERFNAAYFSQPTPPFDRLRPDLREMLYNRGDVMTVTLTFFASDANAASIAKRCNGIVDRFLPSHVVLGALCMNHLTNCKESLDDVYSDLLSIAEVIARYIPHPALIALFLPRREVALERMERRGYMSRLDRIELEHYDWVTRRVEEACDILFPHTQTMEIDNSDQTPEETIELLLPELERVFCRKLANLTLKGKTKLPR